MAATTYDSTASRRRQQREIFRTILAESDVILDMAHRALGPRPGEAAQCNMPPAPLRPEGDDPADGLGPRRCGSVSQVKILLDLSRATLRRQALLLPLLDLAKQKGLTYHWGYPFSMTFHGEPGAYRLQHT